MWVRVAGFDFTKLASVARADFEVGYTPGMNFFQGALNLLGAQSLRCLLHLAGHFGFDRAHGLCGAGCAGEHLADSVVHRVFTPLILLSGL